MTTLNHWIHQSVAGRCPGIRLGRLSALLLPIVAFAFVFAVATATPILAAGLHDTDGDGYVTCSGCTAAAIPAATATRVTPTSIRRDRGLQRHRR